MQIEIVNTILNLLLGGGLIVTLFTLKSIKQKAANEAKKTANEANDITIDSTVKLTKLWEDYAQKRTESDQQQIDNLTEKVNSFEKTVYALKKEVSKLTRAINEAKRCPEADNCPALKKLNDEN